MAGLERATSVDDKVYLSGYLIKQGNGYRTWRKRYFVLNGTKLMYYQSQENMEIEKGSIDLTKGFGVRSKIETMGLGGVEWPSYVHNELAFGIAVEGRTYYLYGDNEDDVKKWKTVLQQVIEKHGNPNSRSYKDSQGQPELPLSKMIRNATKLSHRISHSCTPILKKMNSNESYKDVPTTPTREQDEEAHYDILTCDPLQEQIEHT